MTLATPIDLHVHQLLASVTPRVTRVVRAVLGSTHADVDDVVQQALIGFVQALPAFRGECEPVHFASRIAVRAAVAAARRSGQLRRRRDDGVDLETISADSAGCAENVVEQSRLQQTLRELLSRIPAEQAEAIALRFVLGWSLDEVARVTEAPVNTVRSRVRLAKKALRAAIEADPVLAEELGRDACDTVGEKNASG
ncbi:MAG: polymerase sigma-70 factor, subfamily [Labilithrix sp.]|nr:polymerase sigma-70 factor, subfamily [Labilithrix sp.]